MSTIEQVQQLLPVGSWEIDPVHSHVGFEVDYVGGVFRGSFAPAEARLEVGPGGEAVLRGSARVEDVKVQDETLGAHLLSPDFFDAERTPEIGFASTSVERTGNDVTLAGELTIRGITEPVELTGTIGDAVTDGYGRERVGLSLAGTIDRTDFGLNWNMPLPSGEPALGNEVTLTAELYLVRA